MQTIFLNAGYAIITVFFTLGWALNLDLNKLILEPAHGRGEPEAPQAENKPTKPVE